MTDHTIPIGGRLWIVGKDGKFAALVKEVAGARGWNTFYAASGQGALAQFSQPPADLIFVEVVLSDMSGSDFLAQIHNLEGGKVAFVVVSDQEIEGGALDLLQQGARDFLQKDGQPAVWLRAHLDRILESFEQELRLKASMEVLRQQESARRKQENDLQFLVENIGETISRHTVRGAILYVTPSVEKLLGYTPEELAGKPAESLLLAEDVSAVRKQIIHALRTGQSYCRLELRLVHKNGRQVWVETRLRFARDGQRLREIHSATHDVTDRKRAEEDRRKLEQRMQQAQKMESLGVLAGGIAHDFNNLLAAILGNAELASLELPPASPLRDSLYRVIQAAHRATQLVGQMLVYSGQGRFLVQMLDLAEIVREIARPPTLTLAPIIKLEMEFGSGMPSIQGDPIQIRQVLANLLANAAEAIGDQEGTIRIVTGVMACDRACLLGCFCDENLPEGKYAFVEVADNGCGMTAEVQMKMFEPFFTTKFAGRGLGLAAVLGIMRAHSGAIKVASAPGVGSVFRVLFPAAVGVVAERAPAPASVKSWRGSGTVMVVDDEEDARAAARKHLARLGFLVSTAVDGPHALDIFRKASDEFVCVLLDDAMPHMDGKETFRALRRIRSDIRVILSADTTQLESVRQFAQEEKIGFIAKPYCLETLQQVLQQTLEGQPT